MQLFNYLQLTFLHFEMGFETVILHGDLLPPYSRVESYQILVEELGDPIRRYRNQSEFRISSEAQSGERPETSSPKE